MTLAMVFAAVYLLRSLPAEGAGGFNPLSPCYSLLGFLRGVACLHQVGKCEVSTFFFYLPLDGLVFCPVWSVTASNLLAWPHTVRVKW